MTTPVKRWDLLSCVARVKKIMPGIPKENLPVFFSYILLLFYVTKTKSLRAKRFCQSIFFCEILPFKSTNYVCKLLF